MIRHSSLLGDECFYFAFFLFYETGYEVLEDERLCWMLKFCARILKEYVKN